MERLNQRIKLLRAGKVWKIYGKFLFQNSRNTVTKMLLMVCLHSCGQGLGTVNAKICILIHLMAQLVGQMCIMTSCGFGLNSTRWFAWAENEGAWKCTVHESRSETEQTGEGKRSSQSLCVLSQQEPGIPWSALQFAPCTRAPGPSGQEQELNFCLMLSKWLPSLLVQLLYLNWSAQNECFVK